MKFTSCKTIVANTGLIGWLCLLLSWQMVRQLRSICLFEDTLHVKLGDPTDVKRRILERKKDRTKFTEALLYSLNKEDE